MSSARAFPPRRRGSAAHEQSRRALHSQRGLVQVPQRRWPAAARAMAPGAARARPRGRVPAVGAQCGGRSCRAPSSQAPPGGPRQGQARGPAPPGTASTAAETAGCSAGGAVARVSASAVLTMLRSRTRTCARRSAPHPPRHCSDTPCWGRRKRRLDQARAGAAPWSGPRTPPLCMSAARVRRSSGSARGARGGARARALSWREGRSAYSASHSARPQPHRRSAASASSSPDSASPTAWLTMAAKASRSRAAAHPFRSCAARRLRERDGQGGSCGAG